MKPIYVLVFYLFWIQSCEQQKNTSATEEQDAPYSSTDVHKFWASLQSLCGQAFEGQLVLPESDEDFGGKQLIMHVRSCNENEIKIPFFVGNDRSRTWVFTKQKDRIELKHDHRHDDGTDDEITMYGGMSTNTGKPALQLFPADEITKRMIPAAASNVWWVTIDSTQYTYNLRRLGTDRVFKVVFDLTKEIETPEAPWGWVD